MSTVHISADALPPFEAVEEPLVFRFDCRDEGRASMTLPLPVPIIVHTIVVEQHRLGTSRVEKLARWLLGEAWVETRRRTKLDTVLLSLSEPPGHADLRAPLRFFYEPRDSMQIPLMLRGPITVDLRWRGRLDATLTVSMTYAREVR